MRHEQQTLQVCAGQSKGQRVNIRVKFQHGFGSGTFIEVHDLTPVRPGHRPQRPVWCKDQAAYAEIPIAAIVGKRLSTWIKDLDTASGRNVDATGLWFYCQGNGQAVGECVKYLTGVRIELQQRPSAGRGPETAVIIESQVENGIVQIDPDGIRLAAIRAEAVQLTAVVTTTDDDHAVRDLGKGHGADVRIALFNTGGKGPGNKGPYDLVKLRRRIDRLSSRNALRSLFKQWIRRSCGSRLRRDAKVRRRRPRHSRGRTQVNGRVLLDSHHAERRLLLVAGSVGGQGQKFVAVTGLAFKHG